MKLAALISGGKDSIYAAYQVKKQGHELVCLINLQSEKPDSWMFHVPNAEFVQQQAESMEIPLISLPTSGIKEQELDDLTTTLNILSAEIKILTTQVDDMKIAQETTNKYMIKMNKLTKELTYMKWYSNAIKFDGLQTMLINNLLKIIISDTNMLLTQLDTDIQINIDETTMTFTKENNTFTLKSASGYESFIIDICTKLTVQDHSTFGIGKLIIIDEGLDCIDTINIINFGRIFRNSFMQDMRVMLISHLTDFSEISDLSIEVKRGSPIEDGITTFSEFSCD